MTLRLDRPWLHLDLGTPHRVLSWSITAPGFTSAQHILWREVRNADLPPDMDVTGWFRSELAQIGHNRAVAMITSRDVGAYEDRSATVDTATARCVATTGLSNAEAVGTRLDRRGHDWGTINIAVQISTPLSDAALVESMSIATQARTAAIIAAGHDLPTGRATGTGTDCIAIAAPAGDQPYAGMHTPVGHAVGRAVLDAVGAGAKIWMDTVRRDGNI